MKRYRVAIYGSVELSAETKEHAESNALHEMAVGIDAKEFDYVASEIDPEVLFARPPSDPADTEAVRTWRLCLRPELKHHEHYGIVFPDGLEVWGTVTDLTRDFCTILRTSDGNNPIPLTFALADVDLVYVGSCPTIDDGDL